MKRWESNVYMKKVREAIDTFNLIEPGDRILVGVSGGKDSTLLLYALTQLSRMKIYEFSVEGMVVNHGMLGNLEAYKKFCESEGLILNVHDDFYAESLSHDNAYSPCYTCSRLRKGIVKRLADERGFNKIAYGHTRDDVVETVVMNIVKHGKLAGIPALSEDTKSNVKLIRPLVLLEETAIIKAIDILAVPLMTDLCKFAHGRVRHEAETLIDRIQDVYPNFSEQMVKALQNVDNDRLI